MTDKERVRLSVLCLLHMLMRLDVIDYTWLHDYDYLGFMDRIYKR